MTYETKCSTCNQTLPKLPTYGAIEVICTSYGRDVLDFVDYGSSRASVVPYQNADWQALYHLGSEHVPLVVMAKSEWEECTAELVSAKGYAKRLQATNNHLVITLTDIRQRLA